MTYRLAQYTAEWEQAVARFNLRLDRSGAAPFLLPTYASFPGLVRREHWLVVSPDNEVRGGYLLQFQPAWLRGEVVEATNLQSPLSEGLSDRRYAPVAPWMLRELTRRHQLSYSVGMGGEHMPYPRLLKALGWKLQAVPFFFRVLSGRRFLQSMELIRGHSRWGVFARIGSRIPFLADLAFAALHKALNRPAPLTAQSPVPDWTRIRTRYGFAIDRTPDALNLLYPCNEARFQRLNVPGGSGIVAFSRFRQHKYFGNLRVATLVEALAEVGAERQLLSAALQCARGLRADLLVTNQSAPELCIALRSSGWLTYGSNYLVALAPALTTAIDGLPIYVTRGDGDGLINL